FDLGFESFHVAGVARQGHMDRRDLRARATWAWETARARVDDGAAHAEQILEAMIAERRERPFFWFVNLVECHSPYLPPRPYNDLGLGDRLRAGAEAQRHL